MTKEKGLRGSAFSRASAGFATWTVLVLAAAIVLLAIVIWFRAFQDRATDGRATERPIRPPAVEEEAAAPAIHRQGTVELPQTSTLDLDAGSVPGGEGADIWFQARTATERFISPRGAARIAAAGMAPPDRDDCGGRNLAQTPIPLEQLPTPIHVCVQTNDGRLARFRIDREAGPSPGSMQLTYLTWER